MTRWLCRLGWHQWEFLGEVYVFRFWRCTRCGKHTTT